jgi:SAM-dependent methyltransferase
VTRIAAFRSPDILEYGSGADAFASLTLAHAGYASIGIDASEADVRRARAGAERVSGGVRPLYLAMSLERLDFGDGAFDVVCGTRILHRLRLDRALVEIARVMRPSGAAVFVEPLGCSPLRLRDLRTARAHFGRVEVQAGPLWFVPRVRRQPGYGVLRLAEPF